MQRCTSCRTRKPPREFVTRSDHPSRRRQCRSCRSAQRRKRYLKDPLQEKVYYWRGIGIDVDEAKRRLSQRDNRCELCGSNTPRGMGTWHVDHDHGTKVIRGLLCFPCNNLLGKVERVGLRKIQKYLQRGKRERGS